MRSTLKFIFIAGAVSLFIQGAGPALLSFADQSERVPPTSGIYTGPQFSALLGDAFRSVSTANKGSVAPANVGGSAVDGMEWNDDTATPWIKKRYVNGGWAVEGALDPTDSSYAGVIGGGIASIASASTTDLGSVPQANVTITGTATIASLGSTAKTGVVKFIRFAGALTLTYSSALAVPTGGYDLTTAANDRAIVTHLGSGNWEVTQYTRANGIPIDISAVGKPDFTFAESVPPLHVSGYGQALSRTSYPAYLARVTRTQNGTRTAGNATIASIANMSWLGPGMPVEGTGVAAGCYIASTTSNSIALNSSSCVTTSGTSPITVFLYGYGASGSASTVGVPDCRNRTLAGRDHNLPGALANLLTPSYFGAYSTLFGAIGGTESHSLIAAELPSIAPTFTGAAATITVNATTGNLLKNDLSMNLQGGSTYNGIFGSNTNTQLVSTGAYTPAGSISGFGGNVAHPIVQPTLIAECVVRVTP